MNPGHEPGTVDIDTPTIHGGSTPASMRVMVVANCARSLSLAVNKTAINVARLSNGHAKNFNLVPLSAV
jgi:hypothetical protein